MTAMKIGAIAPWFGGKRTLAPRVVAELGPHTQYFEPFCGSLAVLLAKPEAQKETACDLHGDLTNLARCIACRGTAEDLYDRLQRVVFCDGLLEEARGILERPLGADEFDPTRAYWYFVACWMGRNGIAGLNRQDYQPAVRWTRGGGSPTVRFHNAVASLPAWHRRLLNVVIMRRDAFEVIDRFEDHVSTAVYADPPYATETRSSDDARYVHEFGYAKAGLFGGDDADDHARLARALRQYKRARIVVSAYDCPLYRRLYEGWTFVDCTMLKLLHQQNGRGARAKEAPEVLIVNGPSRTVGWDK